MPSDNGWMQTGALHVQWSMEMDEIKITLTDTNSPPMKLDARKAIDLLKILKFVFNELVMIE